MFKKIGFISVILFSSISYAGDITVHECEAETEKLMSLNSTWGEIYDSSLELPPKCFDGYFAEGISDTIVRKAGLDWAGFLNILIKDSTGKFFNLVKISINASVASEDLDKLEILANSKCTTELAKQCNEILIALKTTSEEAKESD